MNMQESNPNTQKISVGRYEVTIRLQHDDLIYVSAKNEMVVKLLQRAAREKYGNKVTSVAGISSNPGWHFDVATGHKERADKKDDSLPVITVSELVDLAQTVNEIYPDMTAIRAVGIKENNQKTAAAEEARRAEAARITAQIGEIAERNGSVLSDAAKNDITTLLATEIARINDQSRAR